MSKTDPDARLLVKNGQGIADYYNVQAVVDEKHKLIVASEVVNDSSDVGQLHAMAKAAKEALKCEALQELADEGYYSSLELKACEDDGITAYVPVPEGTGRLEKQGRFSRKDFSYDPAANVYRCPAGELLHPMKGRWQNASGRIETPYVSRKAICQTCRLRSACLTEKVAQRIVYRWEHEDVLERHRARMQGADQLMRRRSAIVEPPFGTIKCRAGYRHFLVRGFNKVRGAWSLMALCYNLTRILNILGFEHFMASMAKILPWSPRACRPPKLHPDGLERILDLQLAAARRLPSAAGFGALDLAPIRFIGRISYSFYLFHLACLGLAARMHPQSTLLLFFLVVGFTVPIAWLSWRFVETPFARLKPHSRGIKPLSLLEANQPELPNLGMFEPLGQSHRPDMTVRQRCWFAITASVPGKGTQTLHTRCPQRNPISRLASQIPRLLPQQGVTSGVTLANEILTNLIG